MSSTPSNPTLSRTLGALLGVHAGDSLGATLEFQSWREINSKLPRGLHEIIGGGVFNWPAGHATDDTDLTRAVLLAYLEREKAKAKSKNETTSDFDITKITAEIMLTWLKGSWPARTPGIEPRDIGGATRIGLSRYENTRDPYHCGAGRGQAGNGSLMRCIPTALFTHTPEKRKKESIDISAITHDDSRCTVACAAYNEIVAALVEGKSVEEAVGTGVAAVKESNVEIASKSILAAIEQGKGMDLAKMAREGPEDFNAVGFVIHSLVLAIAALYDERSFEDVLVDIVQIGGDTDTNGAIAGGLLGAKYGVEAIPEKWLSKLQFRKEFEDTAQLILEMQNGGIEG